MLLSDYVAQCRNLVHDPNAADFSNATLIGFANTARTRVALDTQCVQTYLTGFNTITQQEKYPLTGFVGGVGVTAGGSKYTAPTVTLGAPPAPGIAATAVSAGPARVLTGLQVTNLGTLYTAAPPLPLRPP